MPAHHATAERLMDYAAGASAEPTALLVATHLALCPACRREVRRLEAVGGAMLDGIEPVALQPGGLDAVLARLDEPAPVPEASPAPADAETSGLLPEPLRSRLACNMRDVPWRAVTRSLDETDLPAGPPGFKSRPSTLPLGNLISGSALICTPT